MPSLVERAGAGDQEALAQLLAAECARWRASLARSIPRRLRSLIDADDLLQQTCVDAFRGYSHAKIASEAAMSAWFGTIARRNLIDAIRLLRSQKRGGQWRAASGTSWQSSLPGLVWQLWATSVTASRKAMNLELVARLEQAVASLPAHYRAVVRHYDLDQRPIEEVAQELGRSVGATFMLRGRAHRLLLELLGSSGG
jgi:RNA polymerase sigma factor (sigma-70 family)